MFSFKKTVHGIDTFFFQPQGSEVVSLFRIIWGLVLALYFLTDFGNMADFYGPHAIISMNTVQNQFNFSHVSLFQMTGVTYSAVYFLLGVYALAILGTILGLYARTSIFLVLLCMTSFHQRNIWLLSSSECLMRITAIYLLFSSAGHSFSIDALRHKASNSILSAPWAWRLIQIQVSVVYLWTVWHKLKGEDWVDGTAVYYATRLEAMKNLPVPYLLDSVAFIKAATWGTLLLETALGLLIWFKEFRRPLVVIGLLFHLSIEWMMSIPFFELNMGALLLVYLTPQEVRGFIESWKERIRKILESLNPQPTLKAKVLSIKN